MDIHAFLAGYQRAWETADEQLLVSLFAPDGVYHNTPFDEQRGHEEPARPEAGHREGTARVGPGGHGGSSAPPASDRRRPPAPGRSGLDW